MYMYMVIRNLDKTRRIQLSADHGLKQGSGSACDHRRCGTIFSFPMLFTSTSHPGHSHLCDITSVRFPRPTLATFFFQGVPKRKTCLTEQATKAVCQP